MHAQEVYITKMKGINVQINARKFKRANLKPKGDHCSKEPFQMFSFVRLIKIICISMWKLFKETQSNKGFSNIVLIGDIKKTVFLK